MQEKLANSSHLENFPKKQKKWQFEDSFDYSKTEMSNDQKIVNPMGHQRDTEIFAAWRYKRRENFNDKV